MRIFSAPFDRHIFGIRLNSGITFTANILFWSVFKIFEIRWRNKKIYVTLSDKNLRPDSEYFELNFMVFFRKKIIEEKRIFVTLHAILFSKIMNSFLKISRIILNKV